MPWNHEVLKCDTVSCLTEHHYTHVDMCKLWTGHNNEAILTLSTPLYQFCLNYF